MKNYLTILFASTILISQAQTSKNKDKIEDVTYSIYPDALKNKDKVKIINLKEN